MTRREAIDALARYERAVEHARRAVRDARSRGDIDAVARARAEQWLRTRELEYARRTVVALLDCGGRRG